MIIILTFIAFTGLVALISWYKTKEENLSTKEGYFLAGRGLSGLVIAGSLEMTNLSTEQLVGTGRTELFGQHERHEPGRSTRRSRCWRWR